MNGLFYIDTLATCDEGACKRTVINAHATG